MFRSDSNRQAETASVLCGCKRLENHQYQTELEHLQIETRFIDKMIASVMCVYVFLK